MPPQPKVAVGQRQMGFDRLRQGLRRSRQQRQGLVQISGCQRRAARRQILGGIAPAGAGRQGRDQETR